jgi:hypothetical protein
MYETISNEEMTVSTINSASQEQTQPMLVFQIVVAATRQGGIGKGAGFCRFSCFVNHL